MKVKEAIEKYHNSTDLRKELNDLFYNECVSRVNLRLHNKNPNYNPIKPTYNLIDGVIKEVSDWLIKVANGVSFDRKELAGIIKWQKEAILAKFGIANPAAERQIRAMKTAYQFGVAPINVLTETGLEAVSGMILGEISAEARKFDELEKRRKEFAAKLDRTFCNYGIAKRECPNQETYSMVGTLPKSVEDLVFVCKLDKCNKQ
jgi:hypothetical protein